MKKKRNRKVNQTKKFGHNIYKKKLYFPYIDVINLVLYHAIMDFLKIFTHFFRVTAITKT